MTAFHDISFPRQIALGATVVSERRTEIVTLGSGFEERNTRWAHSRRQYDAGQGVRTLDDLHQIVDFFEERRGMLYGFRWHDRIDHKSCAPTKTVSATDQEIGEGDDETTTFQLIKTYGSIHAPYSRDITKPVEASVLIAVDGVVQSKSAYAVDQTNGQVTFVETPAAGTTISAGFEFDVAVRFGVDRLEFNLSTFNAGDIPSIPLLEVRL